jgi:hypothetical protein
MTSLFASSELHKLVANKQWVDANARINSHKPEVFKIRNCESMTTPFKKCVKAYPLHNACLLQAPTFLVINLVQAFPRAVKIPDTGFGRYPLHHAVISKGYPEIVIHLLEHYPEAAKKLDKDGRLPLHYALFNKMPLQVLALLIQAYPEGVKTQDTKGWTPVHLAGASGAPISVMRMLISTYPEVLELKDVHTFCVRDFSIIHSAVSKEVIDYLVMSTPNSIAMEADVADILENTPEDLAIVNTEGFNKSDFLKNL